LLKHSRPKEKEEKKRRKSTKRRKYETTPERAQREVFVGKSSRN
jgi:hypothetical protein